MRPLYFILASLLMSGCITFGLGPETDWGRGLLLEAGNLAQLSGPVIPGTVPLNDLARIVDATYEVNPEQVNFVLPEVGVITMESLTSDRFQALVRVRNQGPDPRCFVDFSVARLENDAGATVFQDDFAFAFGASGVDVNVQTNTCIEPGGVGFVAFSGLSADARSATLISLGRLETSSNSDWQQPAGNLRPLSYAIDGDELRVAVQSDGIEPVVPDAPFSLFILVDDGENPYWFGFFSRAEPSGTVPLGDTVDLVARDFLEGFAGPTGRLVVVTAFSDLSISLRNQAQ
ncbi:MAG: hypothetical protein AAFX94_04340 [Myxococcota bacterium]